MCDEVNQKKELTGGHQDYRINMRPGKVMLAIRRLHHMNTRLNPSRMEASLPKRILDVFSNEPTKLQCSSDVDETKDIKPPTLSTINPPTKTQVSFEEMKDKYTKEETLLDKFVETLETNLSITQASFHEKLI